MNFLIITKIIFDIFIPLGACVTHDSFRKICPDKLLYHYNKSVVVSPLTLRLPMYKLVSVAQGSLKQDLLKVLGYPSTNAMNTTYQGLLEPFEYLKTIDSMLVGKILVNYSNDFKESFVRPAFEVQVEKISFNYPDASTSYVNKMLDRLTYKRITDVLVKGDINNNSSMIIISGAYLKTTWEVPFDLTKTRQMRFRAFTGRSTMVPMMKKAEEVFYLNDEYHNIKLINMKLASYGASMTIVIPEDSKSLNEFLKKLAEPNFFRTIKKRMRMELVDVMIPRFKLKTLVDFTIPIKMIGLTELFDKNNVGLNGVFKDGIRNKTLHVDKVKQKNFIEVNEMGAFWHVTTPDPFNRDRDLRMLETPRLEVVADRPFYFAIHLLYDRSSYWNTEDLLEGVYYGP